MIKDTCTRFKFTYTIIPIEAIFDINSYILDMRTPTEEEQKKIDADKENDFKNHTKFSDSLKEMIDKQIEIKDLEAKR